MEPRITLITLGVDDLQRSLEFYREGLGLPSQGIQGTELSQGAVVFFEMQAGLKLALYPRQAIALDANVPLGVPSQTEFTLAYIVGSKEEVDAVIEQTRLARATIVDSPTTDSGAGIRATSRIPMGICGK